MKRKLFLFVKISGIALFLYFTIVLALYFYAFHGFSSDPAQWGQFGDYVGGLINPIVSLLALIGLLLTLVLEFGDKDELGIKTNIDKVMNEINNTLDIKIMINGSVYYSLLDILITQSVDQLIGDYQTILKFQLSRLDLLCKNLKKYLDKLPNKPNELNYDGSRYDELVDLIDKFFSKTNNDKNQFLYNKK